MSEIISPFPLDAKQGSFEWIEWYSKLTNLLNTSGFEHNTLGGLQGGNTSTRYHLTQAEHTALTTNLSQTISSNFHTYFPSGWA